MKKIILMLALVSIVGCSSIKTMPWDEAEIVGKRFELISDDRVEVFTFSKDRNVAASIGTEEALTAPLMSWTFTSLFTLVVMDDSSRISLKKIYMKGDTVQVLRNGKKESYRVSGGR